LDPDVVAGHAAGGRAARSAVLLPDLLAALLKVVERPSAANLRAFARNPASAARQNTATRQESAAVRPKLVTERSLADRPAWNRSTICSHPPGRSTHSALRPPHGGNQ